MNTLEEKYKKNSLTPAELLELQKKVNAMSAEQLEASLHESWLHDTPDESRIPADRLTALKHDIDTNIRKQKRPRLLPSRLGWIAAAVLLPVFFLTTFHFYRETVVLSSGEVLFSALDGERANVTLPDGTKVTLNSNSSLTYSPGDFNRKERSIDFNGEAYFNVTKNKSIPFIIHTKDLRIKVLGTKFNLHAYAGNETVELTLEEGHVLLSSQREEKELFPMQKAVLDCQDGHISIIKDEVPENASAWKNGELVFLNRELKDVLPVLEKNYGVRIRIESYDDISTDLFTGKIPSENLLDALEILKYSYHMKYHIDNKTIYFSAQ